MKTILPPPEIAISLQRLLDETIFKENSAEDEYAELGEILILEFYVTASRLHEFKTRKRLTI